MAETFDKRSRLATEIIKGVILPQFVILPLAVLLVWFALARGIAPLNALQQRIRRRESQDLSPIDEHDVPEEVAPLVRSINDLLARLDQTMGSQKHFLADAAHQMKTPLAGLRMQAELAQREIDAGGDPQSIKRSLKQIARSSQSAAHLVNQLLAMARAEDTEQARRLQDVPIVKLAREVVRDFVPRAMDKRIDLGYEGPDAEPGRAAPRRPADAGARADPQPRRQRAAVHARRRHRHRAADARPVRPGDGAAGRGHRARASRRTSASRCSSRSTARSAPTSTAAGWAWRSSRRSRTSTAPTVDDRRRRARRHAGSDDTPGALFTVRFAVAEPAAGGAEALRSARSAGCARSTSGTRAPAPASPSPCRRS